MRPAEPSAEGARLVALLNENFDGWGGEARFEWQYHRNPFGTSRTWVLDTGESISGFSAAFPRRLRHRGRTLEAWVLGDFWVARDQRSLGPAIALQRAICDGVDRGEVDLWYDFPSRSMLAVYRRMGLAPRGDMIRYVLPLKVDSIVEDKVGRHLLGRGVSAIGNAMLGGRDAIRRRDPSVSVHVHEGALPDSGPGGDSLSRGVTVDRTGDYLTWRYREDPRGAATILRAEGRARACGYLTFAIDDGRCRILDAFGLREDGVLRELILETIDRARRARSSAVVVGLSDRHPWARTFEELGFRERDRAPFVCYVKPGLMEDDAPWFLMNGDRDV